jgi:hypothetical protein
MRGILIQAEGFRNVYACCMPANLSKSPMLNNGQ